MVFVKLLPLPFILVLQGGSGSSSILVEAVIFVVVVATIVVFGAGLSNPQPGGQVDYFLFGLLLLTCVIQETLAQANYMLQPAQLGS